MKHEVKEAGASVVVAFEGDIDLQTSPAAREALLEAVGSFRGVPGRMERSCVPGVFNRLLGVVGPFFVGVHP